MVFLCGYSSYLLRHNRKYYRDFTGNIFVATIKFLPLIKQIWRPNVSADLSFISRQTARCALVTKGVDKRRLLVCRRSLSFLSGAAQNDQAPDTGLTNNYEFYFVWLIKFNQPAFYLSEKAFGTSLLSPNILFNFSLRLVYWRFK